MAGEIRPKQFQLIVALQLAVLSKKFAQVCENNAENIRNFETVIRVLLLLQLMLFVCI